MQSDKGKVNKNSKISKQNHIIEEIGENGEIQYNCTACRKVFRSRSQRYYHINCNQMQNLVFRCEHCDKRFARQTQWKYHIESHISPVNECEHCPKTFSNPLALKKHLALHKVEPKLCPHCDKTFKKKISLHQHIAAQHLHKLEYGCVYCSKQYASKSTLQLHLKTHEKKRFKCTLCEKLFQRNSTLNIHMKRHNNTNCYICTVCQKVFSEAGALARHSKIHEESIVQYYCILCDKCILRKDNMKRHVITIHPEESYESIVKTIKPLKALSRQQISVENEMCDIYNPRQDNIMKSANSFLIIENKLLHKPVDLKEAMKHLPDNFSKNDKTEEYPTKNHINVITKVVNKEENKNISNEIIKEYKSTIHREENSILENPETCCKNSFGIDEQYDIVNMEKQVFQHSNIIGENNSLVNPIQSPLEKTTKEQQSMKENRDYFRIHKDQLNGFDTVLLNHQQSTENATTVSQTFSSVIKSVGNVTKNLTSKIIATKSIQTASEYKHKKYCRYNYNIDLYRKILGCNEDDSVENVEKQETCEQMVKSSTPLHWRKYFKNNYETSES